MSNNSNRWAVAAVVVPVVLAIATGLAFIAYNNPETYRLKVRTAILIGGSVLMFLLMAVDVGMARAKSALSALDWEEARPAQKAIEAKDVPLFKAMLVWSGVMFYVWLLTFFNKTMP